MPRNIGSFLNDKDPAFTRFPETKPPGVTRICAFGDSHTYGQETTASHDCPSFLQKRFDQDEPSGIEVLNFGSPWHGFGQTFKMWEHFPNRFGCAFDLVLQHRGQPAIRAPLVTWSKLTQTAGAW